MPGRHRGSPERRAKRIETRFLAYETIWVGQENSQHCRLPYNVYSLKVAALITTYNSGAFISTALSSVLTQSPPVDEIIIVDDGSTDNSVSVAAGCLETCEIPFEILELPHTGSVSIARNLGLTVATSDLVAFLDADDHWGQGKLRWALSRFRGDPRIVLAYHSMMLDKQVGFVTPRRKLRSGRAPKTRDQLFTRGPNIPLSSCVVRRDAALSVGGFAEDLTIAEDLDLWFRLLQGDGRFVRSRRCLGSYAVRAGSVSEGTPTGLAIELLPKRWGFEPPLPWWVYVNQGERAQRQGRGRDARAFYRDGLLKSRRTPRGISVLVLKWLYCAVASASRAFQNRTNVREHVT